MNDLYLNKISNDLKITPNQVKEVYNLIFNEDATVPFIARYRKERTGNLDDLTIKNILDKINYFNELDKRKQTITETIKKQGKLTGEVERKIKFSLDKNELEDLYLPYKPQKKTKAAVAKSFGLELLAENIFKQKNININLEINKFIGKNEHLKTYEDVENNIIYIISEYIYTNSDLILNLKEYYLKNAVLETKLKRGKKESDAIKYKDYLSLKEKVSKIPSHRFLAVERAEKEGFISVKFAVDEEKIKEKIKRKLFYDGRISNLLQRSVDYSFKEHIHKSISSFLKKNLKEKSDIEAVEIFKKNLADLLLAPPLPDKVIMGIDPGFRTGAKVVVIDKEGNFKEYSNIFAVEPFNKKDEAKKTINRLIEKYSVDAIAIGNGTASRETLKFVKSSVENKKIIIVTVNEAGASVYSASKEARDEFPDLDVTVRGAISIARRLADPLSELVKIDPKSIGVGQYQHDVNQKLLSDSLDFTVSSIVNKIGVNLNNSSKRLLSYVSGISSKAAENILEYRKVNGSFKSRDELKKVKGIGPKIYKQAIGFLIVENNDNFLDKTRVHPESYGIAIKLIKTTGLGVDEFVNLKADEKSRLLSALDIKKFVNENNTDEYTVNDIIDELIVPLRDPRKNFEYAKFSDNIKSIEDLKTGMVLEGVVNNITKFGAFVDIGLHESGLIHISEISNEYISDINKVLKNGQVVKVKVIDVDMNRKRISLSLKQV